MPRVHTGLPLALYADPPGAEVLRAAAAGSPSLLSRSWEVGVLGTQAVGGSRTRSEAGLTGALIADDRKQGQEGVSFPTLSS